MDSAGEACIILSACQLSHPFEQRRVCVPADELVRIGRSVAKAQPAVDNFVFDCKVLSRTHAVVWYEDGGFFIKDTKSSNGTFVNGQRLSKTSEESPPYEVFSGDIVQLGVEILENTKTGAFTHSCIVAMLRLYHPNGLEALKRDSCDSAGRTISSSLAGNVVQAQDVYQIQLHLRESAYREQIVESKLAALGALVSSTQEATEQCWQVLIDEDRLLSRIETLEAQLELLSKTYTEDELRNELFRLTSEKANIESAAKESLRRVMTEKMDAIQRVTDIEQMLENCAEDCSRLKANCELTQKELAVVVEQHGGCLLRVKELQESLAVAEAKNRKLEGEIQKRLATAETLVTDGVHMLQPVVVCNATTDRDSTGSMDAVSRKPVLNGDWKEATAADDHRHESALNNGKEPRKAADQSADYEDQLVETRRRIRQLQDELAFAQDELQRRTAEVESLESRLKISDKQLSHLVEQAVRDILRRFEEVIYQKFKNEELILFLKEQVHQLEQRFKPSHLVNDDYLRSPLSNGTDEAEEWHQRRRSCSESDLSAYGCERCNAKGMDGAFNKSTANPPIKGSSVSRLLRQLKDKVESIDENGNNLLKEELTNIHDMLEASLTPPNGETMTLADHSEQLTAAAAVADEVGSTSTAMSEDDELEATGAAGADERASRSQAEFANFKQECVTLRQRIVAIEQDVKNTRKENVELVARFEQMKQSCNSLKNEKAELLRKQRQTDQQLDTVRRKNENLAEQLVTSQKELKKIADCKALMELENLSLRAKLQECDSITAGGAMTEPADTKPVEPTSLLPLIPIMLVIIALAIAFYPWLVSVTLTDDGPADTTLATDPVTTP